MTPTASPTGASRYHKLGHDDTAIERLFVDVFLEAQSIEARALAKQALDLARDVGLPILVGLVALGVAVRRTRR